MTVAPTLQKGLKRLFSSAVLRIIASVLAIVGLIVTIIGGVAAFTGSEAGGIAALAGIIVTIISPILVIIAAILSLVGIINVSKENGKFKTALYAVLANIVLVIIAMFLGQNPTVATIINLLANICNIVMFVFICSGIYAVGEKLGRTDFLGQYNAIIIFYVLSAVFALIGGFVLSLYSVFSIISSICSFISYILYMGYLRKAIHAVDGVPTAEQYAPNQY